VIHHAPSGEKHIADLKTPHGLFIEFQHSFLQQQERASREAFYGKLVWVVNGTRRKRDRVRFFDSIQSWWRIASGIFLSRFVEEALPREWLDSSVPVYFDFGGPSLWSLMPKRPYGYAVVVAVRRAAVIDAYRNGREIFNADELIRVIEACLRSRLFATRAAFYLQQRHSKPQYRKRPQRRNWRSRERRF
jgi:hypothetical protein